MGKKKNDVALRIYDYEQKEIEDVKRTFYPSGLVANFIPSSDINISAVLGSQTKEEAQPLQSATQVQLESDAFSIREKVMAGMPNNVEIRFDRMVQLFGGEKWPLDNTIFSFREWDEDASPRYIYIKADATLDLRIFIDGDKTTAIMAFRNEKQETHYTKLRAFHMVSVQENSDPRKEMGVVTSYSWLTAKVYSTIVMAYSLNAVRDLVMAEWLQAEWEQAQKVSEKQPVDESLGGGVVG